MHPTETSGSAESSKESQNCCRSLRSVCSGGVFTLIDRCLSLSHSLWWPPGLRSLAGSEFSVSVSCQHVDQTWPGFFCDHQEVLWPRWSCKPQEVPQKLLRSSGEELSTEVCYCLVVAFVSKCFGRIRRTLHRFRNDARLSVDEQIHGLIPKLGCRQKLLHFLDVSSH